MHGGQNTVLSLKRERDKAPTITGAPIKIGEQELPRSMDEALLLALSAT